MPFGTEFKRRLSLLAKLICRQIQRDHILMFEIILCVCGGVGGSWVKKIE